MQFQDISILIPAKSSAEFIIPKIQFLKEYLQENWKARFEIIVSLNGGDDEIRECYNLVNQAFPNDEIVIAHKHYFPKGKGAALQSASMFAQYPVVAFIDSDLPFDLDFFKQGMKCINEGSQLVAGNRRLPESLFSIPVPLLSFVYKRHLSGLLYNWVVRKIFSLDIKDTQCGIKMMTKSFSDHFFGMLSCYGFSFDVEMFILAKERDYKISSIPVNLKLSSEKSTLTLTFEMFRALLWFFIFKRKQIRGEYSKKEDFSKDQLKRLHFTSDDWGISEGVNEAILVLAQKGVIKRVSIMSNAKHTDYLLEELKKLSTVELGLHFNLTNGQLLGQNYKYLTPDSSSSYSLMSLLKKSLFGFKKLPKNFLEEAREEFKLQVENLRGKQVELSYFDSHHHIHLLPGMLEAIGLSAMSYHMKQTRLVIYKPLPLSSKIILHFLSLKARKVLNLLELRSLPMAYPGAQSFLYASKLRNELMSLEEETEIIVHPSVMGDLHLLPESYQDEYNGERVREYWALKSLVD